MTQPLLLERQRTILQDLTQSAAERARAEESAEKNYRTGLEAVETEFRSMRERISVRFESAKAAAVAEFQAAQAAITTRFETDQALADKEKHSIRQTALLHFQEAKESAETEYEESRWTTTTMLEASKKAATTQLEKDEQAVRDALKEIETTLQEANKRLASWGRLRSLAELPVPARQVRSKQEPVERMTYGISTARQRQEELTAMTLPAWTKLTRLVPMLVLAWVLATAPAVLFEQPFFWAVGSTLVTILAGLGLHTWLTIQARRQVLHSYVPLRQALLYAEASSHQVQEVATARYKRETAEATGRCHRELRQADERYQPLLTALEKKRDHTLRQADEKHQALTTSIRQRRDTDWRQAEEKYQRLVNEATDHYEAESTRTEQRHTRQIADLKQAHEKAWQTLTAAWRQALARVQAGFTDVACESEELFPDWADPCWDEWKPPQSVPLGIRFGRMQVSMAQIPNGVSADERLRAAGPAAFSLPALLPFPTNGSVLLKAEAEGRDQAVAVLQTLMLRLLTAIPPSKVRFVIVDPVGLGENFAAFMHLADHDEALVTNRIWAEPPHIEQRLADLTEHMGNVIQKYLRNQYPTIEDYNAQAGEVAEPYRVLVVANFPVNFSSEAARRLVSITASGGSCGVYTLVSVDTRQPMPHGFNLADLEQPSVNLVWKDQNFQWKDPDFGRFPLQLDVPPDSEFFTNVLQKVGEKAKAAKRVEVMFDFVAPAPGQWWTSDSRSGIRVALGRSGATRRQMLELGHGTAQHVLIAGKTGSGKSTLLHALITNLALLYSPDEVELYLIDFKKGVEFKTYATHELPHARVVAVESEREFGLSVLQRLDAELKTRGERYRTLGVNDLASYRGANGKEPSPRILLIVDEFQEFFTEDDKIAQEAALLLDRLVRQGRAFGLHVLLGSQTLGGAYTLARSTIDQMAVRIALQCSETDAHLILSKDNAAARLLSRPGEAIYNDANGLVEGNDIFQIVWLDDDRREQYLQRVQEMARARHYVPPQPQIVFEGNAPAEVSKNHLLRQLLEAPAWPAPPRAAYAWMGSAIAIKEPTAAVFRPQTASNLVILGQQEESALGVLSMALMGLAVQYPAVDGARFYVLDGSPVDAPHAGYLARLAEVLPHPVRVVGWRDLPAVIGDVADEVSRREKEHTAEAAACYLLIHGLQWFRDLRKSEDDFSFSRRGEDKPANPAKQLATILREGPGVRIHSLIWCDTLANLQRSLDRQGLREFEMRVLFQMSIADSSNLIDSPAAGKLGLHHALFATEDRAQPEKFRPYGLPTEEWLSWVRQQLRGRLAATR